MNYRTKGRKNRSRNVKPEEIIDNQRSIKKIYSTKGEVKTYKKCKIDYKK